MDYVRGDCLGPLAAVIANKVQNFYPLEAVKMFKGRYCGYCSAISW